MALSAGSITSVTITDSRSVFVASVFRSVDMVRRRALERASRTGDCWDNAVAESFFATLRAELVDHETYATREAAERTIGQCIEDFYNAERLHSHLDYVSPIEFELKAHVAAIAA